MTVHGSSFESLFSMVKVAFLVPPDVGANLTVTISVFPGVIVIGKE